MNIFCNVFLVWMSSIILMLAYEVSSLLTLQPLRQHENIHIKMERGAAQVSAGRWTLYAR